MNIEQVYSVIVLIFFLIFWVILILDSIKHHRNIPWDFSIVLIGLLIFRWEVTVNQEFRFDLSWIVSITILRMLRLQFDIYYIQWKNLLPSILIGGLSGLLLFVGFFFFLKMNQSAGEIFTLQPITGALVITMLGRVIGEELIFRSFIFGRLNLHGMRPQYANVVQAVLFTLSHFPKYIPTQQYFELFTVLILGLSAGCITYKYNNVGGAIFLHTIFNLTSLLVIV